MWRTHWIMLAVLATVCVAGCGGSDQPAANPAEGGDPAAALEPPAAAVAEFLEAMRAGDDEKTSLMMSEAARETAAQMNLSVAPQGSDTAKFEVGAVEWVSEDGARVPCTWTDVDEKGNSRSEQATWMVRRESQGWRIAGLAYQVFADQPPLLLNFEDAADLQKKQQWVRQEVMRRAQAANSQAQRPEVPENSLQR